jgi:hypothetical protein
MALELLLTLFHKRDIFFRLENDEDGYYLSIIDRGCYPRIWVDKFQEDQPAVIAQTVDNLINKNILAEKDWRTRFHGETIEECIEEFNKWDKENRLPRLK